MTNPRAGNSSGPRGAAHARSLLGRCAWLIAGAIALSAVLVGRAAADENAPPAAVFADALSRYRTEGPPGWSFTQKTVGDGHSRVERFDAAQPDFDRWSLLEQDGRPPTADERQDYREKLSRRSRGGTAPRLTDQLDLTTLSVTNDDADRMTLRFRLKPGEEGDNTARFLQATIVLHKSTRTIESLELASTESFSPTFGVRIAEMQTILRYSLPEADRPSLLLSTQTRLRGRAFWFKSLDADLTVTFSDHTKAGRR